MTTQITIHRPTKTLRHQYPGQGAPQPCYVELDCELGTLAADWNAEIGSAVPARVWHGITKRWRIPLLSVRAVNKLLTRLRPLAARMLEGYRTRWNGSNHVGCLTDESLDVEAEICRLCEMAEE